jgi:hypothetical protein
MEMKIKLVIALSICLLFTSLHAGDTPMLLETCKQICDAYVKEVGQALYNDMLNKGIEGTVPTCAKTIDKICYKYSEAPGNTLERTTLLRLQEQKRSHSPEAEMLRSMIKSANTEEAITEDHTWTESDDGEKSFIYMRAIKVEPLCLSCHGPSEIVQPKVKQLMMSEYHALPSENQLGEIKGAVVVNLKFPEAESYIKEFRSKQKKEASNTEAKKQ